MEWQVILALVLVVPIILFPAIFIWYINITGMYAAIRERGGVRVLAAFGRAARTVLVVLVPLAVYGFLIWFFYGHFSWQVTLAVALVFPIVLFVPALIWVAVISGLYQVASDRLRRTALTRRRRVGRIVEEPVSFRRVP
jgi:hypothetical protein